MSSVLKKLEKIATSVDNSYIEKCKADGQKVVGYGGTYIPEEVIYAAGCLPYRLRGIEAGVVSNADAYYGPVNCSFAKSVLESAIKGKFDFLDGAIITYECDHMRRLFDTWRSAAKDFEGILPSFFYYYGLPHVQTDITNDFLLKETKNLIAAMEKHFNTKIDEEKLKKAIDLFNKKRTLQKDVYKFLEMRDPLITGTEALAMIIAGTAIPPEIYNNLLTDLISDLDSGVISKKDASDKPRLMIVGSAIDDIDFIRLIEDSGSIIVTDSLCFGRKCFYDLVKSNGDPLKSIVLRYFGHISCPRMFEKHEERYNFIKDAIKNANVDGVILQHIKFCDLHGVDNMLFERDLESEGIPCLRIEREYGSFDTGRIKTRVDAFLERIRGI